jgi:hypothetical protein
MSIPVDAVKCRFCGEFVRPRASRFSDLIRQHIGLVLAFTTSIWVVFKLLSVCRYRPVTALALLQAAGVTNVLSGMFVMNVSLVLFGAAATLLYLLIGFGPTPVPPLAWIVLLGAMALVALLLVPWTAALGLLVTVGFVGTSAWISTSARVRRAWKAPAVRSPTLPRIAAISYVAITVLITLTSQMWLPSGRIETRDDDVLVGYVVSDDGFWTTVLREKNRTIVRIPADSILTRQVCELPTPERKPWQLDPSKPSLAEILFGSSAHPPTCFTSG